MSNFGADKHYSYNAGLPAGDPCHLVGDSHKSQISLGKNCHTMTCNGPNLDT